jgi:hypothetical protein
MAMLTHPGSKFQPASYRSGRRHTAGATTAADFAMLKRFCLCALTVLLAGGAVAGIIVLKTAIALSRISH